MPPSKLILAIAFGASAALFGASPVQGAETSRQCDDKLIDLGSMQAALTEMEDAVAQNESHQAELRAEASELAATIAEKLRGGASELDVEPLMRQRAAALSELEQVEQMHPVLTRQLEALVNEVDHAERDYIACVESALE